jgi:transposase-like protein
LGRPSRAEVARSLGISENTLANWMRADQERRERDAATEWATINVGRTSSNTTASN